MGVLSNFNKALENSWWSRIMIVALYWIAIDVTAWSQSFASTALAMLQNAKAVDLMGIAATIGAVTTAPLALLTLALTSYNNMRATKPTVVADRRKEDP